MRRDGGGHADGDTRRAVDQQIRDGSRQHSRFCQRVVKIGGKINRVLANVGQDVERGRGQARFGITHGSRRVAIDRAEVTLSVHQQGTHGEILRHTRHGFIHSRIAVRVIFTQHFAHDTRGFLVRRISAQTHIVHGIQDAAVHGLKPVTGVGSARATMVLMA